MLDYKLLDALAAVVEQKGFERAGEILGLTQSAVSQRIKLLEARLGQPVLVRAPLLEPTPLGRQLLYHVKQVQLLEHNLTRRVPRLGGSNTRLRIALNDDSLVTWWALAVAPFCRENRVLFDLVIEDQDIGLRRMSDGEVAGCVCSSEQAVQGARSVYLDTITYRAFASKAYLNDFFPDGPTEQAFSTAPAIVFGPHDQLHDRFMAKAGFYGRYPYHLCPSSEGFVKMVSSGLGYGVMPEIQVAREVASGELAAFADDFTLEVSLYWYYWRMGGPLLEGLTKQLLLSMPIQNLLARH